MDDPDGLDIDEGAGKIYWAEWGRIGRANLNGSQVETIGSVWGADIALDVDGGKAYLAFESFSNNRIYRTGLTGSPVETLVSEATEFSSVIALDLSRGKMYWAGSDWGDGGVLRANLNGSQVEAIVTGIGGVYDLFVDEGEGKIYWGGLDGILRANLDGSQVETFFSVSARGIALDKGAGKIYWTEQGEVMRASLSDCLDRRAITAPS